MHKYKALHEYKLWPQEALIYTTYYMYRYYKHSRDNHCFSYSSDTLDAFHFMLLEGVANLL